MDNNKLLLKIGIGVAVLLVIFLLFDSGATISMVDQLLVFALGAMAGYFIVTKGVALGQS